MARSIIGIINTKGGVGKTTTAVNLAAMLADGILTDPLRPARVLLIDMDPQGSASRCVARKNSFDDPDLSLTPSLIGQPVGRIPLDNVICQSPWSENLFYIPIHTESMNQADGVILSKSKKPYEILRRLVTPIQQDYDYIVVDFLPTATSFNVFFFNGLSVINAAIIPTQLTRLALEGLPATIREIESAKDAFEHEIQLLGVLPTEWRRVNTQSRFLEVINRDYPGLVFQPIPLSTDVSDAFAAREPLHVYSPKASATQAYIDFGKEALRRA